MKNLKLVVRLLGGFTIVALLVLVVGYFGLTGARTMSDNARLIGENILPKTSALQVIKEAQTAFDSEENGLMGKDADEATIKDAHDMMDEAQKRQDDAVKTYDALPKTGKEAELWQQIVPALDSFWKAHLEFMDTARQYEQVRTSELAARLATQSVDVEDPMRDRLGGLLDQAIELNAKEATAAVQNAQATSARVSLVATIGLIAGPVLALLLGTLLAFSITGPLARGVQFAQIISGGDFTQHLDVHRGDEVGVLVDALNAMGVRLNAMAGTIRDNASQVASSSEQINASSVRLAEGAQSQASTLEETSASVEELTASVEQVAQHARTQADAMERGAATMSAVEHSIHQVTESLAGISELASRSVQNAAEGGRAVQEVVSGINRIAESSDKIGGIVSVISDIADQTNLLALNASIEAARAGGHGRGFAVVADEVSKLADRSAASTKQIAALIKESGSQVARGVETANGSRAAIGRIQEASQQVQGMIGELSASLTRQIAAVRELSTSLTSVREMSQSISAATQEQSLSSRQVSVAVENVNEITQSAAGAAEEMSAATAQLAAMAQGLQGMVAQFRISGHKDTVPPAPVD